MIIWIPFELESIFLSISAVSTGLASPSTALEGSMISEISKIEVSICGSCAMRSFASLESTSRRVIGISGKTRNENALKMTGHLHSEHHSSGPSLLAKSLEKPLTHISPSSSSLA